MALRQLEMKTSYCSFINLEMIKIRMFKSLRSPRSLYGCRAQKFLTVANILFWESRKKFLIRK